MICAYRKHRLKPSDLEGSRFIPFVTVLHACFREAIQPEKTDPDVIDSSTIRSNDSETTLV
jgi:hypothetical protein